MPVYCIFQAYWYKNAVFFEQYLMNRGESLENKMLIRHFGGFIYFDGGTYVLSEGGLSEEYAASRRILTGFSPDANYSRVINLNVSHLIIPLSSVKKHTR